MSLYTTRFHATLPGHAGARQQDLGVNARAALERFLALPADDATAARDLSRMLAPRIAETIAKLPDGALRGTLAGTRELLEDLASGKNVNAPSGIHNQLDMVAGMLARAYPASKEPERSAMKRLLGQFAGASNAVVAQRTAPPPMSPEKAALIAEHQRFRQLQRQYDDMAAAFEAMKTRVGGFAKPTPAPSAEPAGDTAPTQAAAATVDAPPAVPARPPHNDGVGAVVTGIARGAATVVGGVLATVAGIGAGLVVGPFVGAAAAWNGITSWFTGGQK